MNMFYGTCLGVCIEAGQPAGSVFIGPLNEL